MNWADNTGVLMLSIVMITVPDRAKSFRRIRRKIKEQVDYCKLIHPTLGDVEVVEVLTPLRSEGGPSIGVKRQIGLEKSEGEYVCWLDDDDNVSPDYVEQLLRQTHMGADVITFNNISKFDNFWTVIRMNLITKLDDQVKPGIIDRRPYHVCAWRRSMLVGIRFPDQNWDEDTEFVTAALRRAKTQTHIDNILHEYNRIQKSLA